MIHKLAKMAVKSLDVVVSADEPGKGKQRWTTRKRHLARPRGVDRLAICQGSGAQVSVPSVPDPCWRLA